MCGIGCLMRGLASGETMVYTAAAIMGAGGVSFEAMTLALVTRGAPPNLRQSVVSGFLTQVHALSLVAKSIYPAWDLFCTES